MRLAQLVARSEDQARVSIQPSYLQREEQQQQQPAILRANAATTTARENVCRMTLMVPPVIPSIDGPLLPRYVFDDETPHADDRQDDSMATREREYLEHVYCLLANAATSVRAQSAGQACVVPLMLSAPRCVIATLLDNRMTLIVMVLLIYVLDWSVDLVLYCCDVPQDTNTEMLMLVYLVWSTVGCHRCAVEQRRPGSRRSGPLEHRATAGIRIRSGHAALCGSDPTTTETRVARGVLCADDRDRAAMRLRREEHPSGDVHGLGHQSRLQLGDSNRRGTSIAGTVPRGCVRETEASPSTRRRTRSSLWRFI